MNYYFCLRPHDNGRYQEVQCMLAKKELACIFDGCALACDIELKDLGGAPFLCFSTEAALPKRVYGLSCLYFAATGSDDALTPYLFDKSAFVPSSMPHLPKYKGKTNVAFTRLLINLALSATQLPPSDAYTLLDPLSGRGTALYMALSMGLNAIGVEQNADAVRDAVHFAQSFFTHEHIPFKLTRASKTLGGGKSAPECTMAVGGKERQRFLTLLKADTRDTVPAVKRGVADLITADLPYGVQHAPGQKKTMARLPDMLKEALPAYHSALKKGGGIALSFNTYTLKTDTLKALLQDAGFTPLGHPYDGFEHRVEQAISRDIVVARA